MGDFDFLMLLKILAIALAVFLGAVIVFAVFTIISANLIDCSKEYETNSIFYRFLLDFWTAFMVVVMRIKIRKKGMEKIPEGRFLVVGNHRSNFDPIITWYLLRKNKLAYITKPENFNVPFFGKIIRKCCFLGIDRENPRNAIKTVNKAAELIEKDEVSVGVYPEGTRNKTEDVLLPFHNGMFKIAKKAEVPIVVVTVKGTSMIHKNFPKHKSEIEFSILDVLSKEEVAKKSDGEIGEKVRNLMLADLTKN